MAELHLQHSLINVLLPIMGLSINVVTQIMSFRVFSGLGLLKSVFFGFIAGIIGMLGLEITLLPHVSMELSVTGLPLLFTNLIIYGALGYCYFHFINLGETARRIRIVCELHNADTGLTLSEILERYNSRKMVDLRIKRMLNIGQVLCHDGAYIIGKPFLLFISRIILIMKFLILGKTSEFN